ncbi:hypothetical protein QFZ86_002289 [Pseudomonas plecoglossicida]
MGPAKPCSAKLTAAEEAMEVELRQRTMFILDDMLGHLLDYFPQLSRSALHRCRVRHGINQAPKTKPQPNAEHSTKQRGAICTSIARNYA